tara:strand:+ start:206 stop:841 length:636 start_codon:yes stop_codon:yes gene_type:complete
MYKIIRDEFSNSENTIHRISTNTFITAFSGSAGWRQFIDDIYTNGIEIVEGADYVGVTTYTDARKAEYPPLEEQLDKIYHSGVDAWKADIKKIKDKYPKTQVGITSIAPLPSWIDTIIFEKQKEEYEKAKARLAQYELANGKKEVVGTEKVWDVSTNSYVDRDVTDYVIQPLPLWVDGVRNPLVVQDEKERAEAQEVINKTPQAVIDSINT